MEGSPASRPASLASVEDVDNPIFSPRAAAKRLSIDLENRHSSPRPVSSLSYEGRASDRVARTRRSSESTSSMIHPRNENKIYWDGYILLLVWYSVTYELYHTTMGDHLEGKMTFTDWFVDISYWTDIALNFRTGYDEDGRGYRYVMDSHKSAVRYLKGWFTVDFVSTFPYALFEATSGHPVSLLRLLRVTRLVRILRAGGNAVELFSAAVAKFRVRAAYLDIVRFLSGILLSIHFLSCLFHLLGVLEKMGQFSPGSMAVMWSDKEATWLHQYNLLNPTDAEDGKPPKAVEASALSNADVDVPVPMWTKYLYSTYWAITTVTTIGYGDITPVTNVELVFVCVAELLGMFMFVYTTNNVAALLRGLDAKRTAFQEHLDRIHEYMEARSIPTELQRRVVQYLTFINSPKCLTESKEDELLGPLTGTLRDELRMASYVPWLTRNQRIRELLELTGGMFHESSSAVAGDYHKNSELEGFVHKLSLQLHSVSAAPYDLIINAADGESCTLTMYFLLTGKVHLYGNVQGSEGDTESGSHVICTIDQSDKRALFGSYELFETTPPPEWCIEAAEYCDLACISRTAFQSAVLEEEHEHVKFHLENAFPWTKNQRDAPQILPSEPASTQATYTQGFTGTHDLRSSGHSRAGRGDSGKLDEATPRTRRSSITDQRGSVSTGRRMVRRRSITSTIHGDGVLGATGPGLELAALATESSGADDPPEPEPQLESAPKQASNTQGFAGTPESTPGGNVTASSGYKSPDIDFESSDHSPADIGDSGKQHEVKCTEVYDAANNSPEKLAAESQGAASLADRARQQPVGSETGKNGTPAPRTRRSTGRRMARRRSIASTMHGGGTMLGVTGLELAALATGTPGLGLELPAFATVSSGSDGDLRSSLKRNEVELEFENCDDVSENNASIASAGSPPQSTSTRDGGAESHPGALRADQKEHERWHMQERQEWEKSVATQLQGQAMAISVMQGQIGMLCQMMRDVNSKLDTVVQLQRSRGSSPTPTEQSMSGALAVQPQPDSAHAKSQADASIVEGEEEEEEEDQGGLAAAPDYESQTTEQLENDL